LVIVDEAGAVGIDREPVEVAECLARRTRDARQPVGPLPPGR